MFHSFPLGCPSYRVVTLSSISIGSGVWIFEAQKSVRRRVEASNFKIKSSVINQTTGNIFYIESRIFRTSKRGKICDAFLNLISSLIQFVPKSVNQVGFALNASVKATQVVPYPKNCYSSILQQCR